MCNIPFKTPFARCLPAALMIFALSFALPIFAESSFTLFESGQVRPLALSADGSRLYAVNTPDNRLEVFEVEDHRLKPVGSVVVGLEPVAVAVRSEHEVWVVNHLSDSVSVVNVDDEEKPRVVRTLLIGDEPRDIVFAGPHRSRAFITTAHRGQNLSFDPQLTTAGVGRADVWVFNAGHPGNSLGGDAETVVTLFTDTPRALAVSPDGSRVYVAGFHTGNLTTAITEDVVSRNGGLPPLLRPELDRQAPTGLIVKYRDSVDGKRHWQDELNRIWDNQIMFSLPDKDVFVLDANASPPVQLPNDTGYYAEVGTVLFNMAVNPANGHVYVSNTDAQNEKRFEGAGQVLGTGHSVRGHLAESRITVLDGNSATPRHLNKHIDYEHCCAPIPNDENSRSLAFPMEMAVTRDGKTLFVSGFGSSKIGIYDTEALENDTFVPSTDHQIALSGGGPTGLVLDESHHRLYVLTRFNNAVAVIDTRKGRQVGQTAMHNPEPASITLGRRFLYDASFTSSHGDSACASCHIFGDFDSLAWDLGDPDNLPVHNPGPFRVLASQFGLPDFVDFQGLKGPMTTQSLRGMANHGPMHWRGDRTGGNDAPSAQPDSGTFDEQAAFKKFNVAFPGLNGRDQQLTEREMQAFTDFILQVTYPPNPNRQLDNSLTPDQQAGHDFYFGDQKADTFFNCNGCHVLDPKGNKEFGVAKPGFFGTDGQYSFEAEPQVFKIPHLRNLYQKVGMFGMPANQLTIPAMLPDGTVLMDKNGFQGDQVRGFGYLHDGSADSVFRFVSGRVFAPRPPKTAGPIDPGNPDGFPLNATGFQQRKQMEQFLLAYDSNLAPIVGQQVTLTRRSVDAVGSRIDLLIARADVRDDDGKAAECELVAKSGRRGYLYQGSGMFKADRARAGLISDAVLRRSAIKGEAAITYTCVPPGSGVRIGLDRDEDGILDGDDRS